MRKCGNCKNRCFRDWLGVENCWRYEIAETEQQEIEYAEKCTEYEEGAPDCIKRDNDDDYCPSATRGDYSPSNPWDAPGMSIKDFI